LPERFKASKAGFKNGIAFNFDEGAPLCLKALPCRPGKIARQAIELGLKKS
jgi:hypothetical protein